MQQLNLRRTITVAEGVVRQVDNISRELELRTSVDTINLDVPPDCIISLRGERVKLRLIQSLDRVRVKYVVFNGANVAETIEVQPDFVTSK